LTQKVLQPFLGINEYYNKVSLEIWELHNKISSWGVSLKDEDEDPKFMFCYMKLGTNGYVKNVFLQEILQFDEDESLVFLLLDDPNSDP
jgi:hypothetical protein